MLFYDIMIFIFGLSERDGLILDQCAVIGITQPPPKEGARSALSSNLSKSGLEYYAVKRSKRHLLEEVA